MHVYIMIMYYKIIDLRLTNVPHQSYQTSQMPEKFVHRTENSNPNTKLISWFKLVGFFFIKDNKSIEFCHLKVFKDTQDVPQF